MGPVKRLVDLVAGVLEPFPPGVQPGLFAASCLLVAWLVAKRGRVLWCWAVRAVMVVVGTTTGLLLYPEYLHTTARRGRGAGPSSVALGVTPLADRLLDTADAVRASHPRPPTKAWGQPPWWWMVGLCAASAGLYFFLDRPEADALTPLAQAVFDRWSELRAWAAQP